MDVKSLQVWHVEWHSLQLRLVVSLYVPLGQEVTQEPALRNLPVGHSKHIFADAPEHVLPKL